MGWLRPLFPLLLKSSWHRTILATVVTKQGENLLVYDLFKSKQPENLVGLL